MNGKLFTTICVSADDADEGGEVKGEFLTTVCISVSGADEGGRVGGKLPTSVGASEDEINEPETGTSVAPSAKQKFVSSL